MFLLATVIFRDSPRGIAEPDIWWHLRNADYLFQYHLFPRVNTYSLGAAGSPRLNYEWLSEIPFLLGFDAWGLQGLLAVYFAVFTLIYICVYYRSCHAGADYKSAFLATLLAILLGVVSIGPRVLLFGWLCMVGLLLVLDHFQRTGKGLWPLPLLFALWVNLHGSWIFGLAVLGLTIAAGLVEGEWGLVVARRWSPQELKKLLLALAASLAALFVNPFGYTLVRYPFDFLFRQQTNMQHVQEWQSVDFGRLSGKMALIMIFALLAAALFSRQKWKLDEVLLMAFSVGAALVHVRFLFFAGLIVAPILAQRLNLFPPYRRERDQPWLNACVMATIVGAMIFLFPSAAYLQRKVDADFPTAALKFMQEQHLNGRIFNEYAWGGYMEWYAPDLKPLIDTRTDIFIYNGVFDDYLRVAGNDHSFQILDRYKIDYVLLPPKRQLIYLLEQSPAWRPIYTDKVAALFERVPGSGATAKPSAAQSD
ncbi:MAG: hypothetical protein ABSD63_12580 [Candidatus Korobacteraceae bacterium]|jgi:hypothetical protein